MKVRWNHEKWGPPPLNLTKNQYYNVNDSSDRCFMIEDDENHLYLSFKEYFIEQPTQTQHFECEYGDEHKMDNFSKNMPRFSKIKLTTEDNVGVCPSPGFIGKGQDKKEEFKQKDEIYLNKLGWYESYTNKKFKIVHELPLDSQARFVGFCQELGSEPYYFEQDGRCVGFGYDLVKYLGPELPKKPRKFEFEASITEIDNFNKGIIITQDVEPYSKWKVTMTEVLE